MECEPKLYSVSIEAMYMSLYQSILLVGGVLLGVLLFFYSFALTFLFIFVFIVISV